MGLHFFKGNLIYPSTKTHLNAYTLGLFMVLVRSCPALLLLDQKFLEEKRLSLSTWYIFLYLVNYEYMLLNKILSTTRAKREQYTITLTHNIFIWHLKSCSKALYCLLYIIVQENLFKQNQCAVIF